MRRVQFSWKQTSYLLLLAIALLAVASCNLRENILLPPDLTPEDYVQSSSITSKDNYLIKSTTDNSFLLINKQAIADSVIQIGDEIVFLKTDSFTDRDSLHVSSDQAISPSLDLYIKRNGVYTALTFAHNYPYITCYTDMKNEFTAQTIIYCLNLYTWLDGKVSYPAQYAKERISFHPFGTGSNQLYSISSMTGSVSFTADTGNHYVWMTGTQDRVSFFLPVTVDHTEIDINSVTQLDSVSTRKIQGVFPDFALYSSIIDFQASQVLGNAASAPLMKLQENALPNRFPKQWIVVAPNQLFAWESSPETWVMTDNDLIAPCRINGTYMLIAPLESQNEFSIPLDAGLKQVYAHNFWFDLKDVNLSGISFKLDFDFTPSTGYQNYFSGHPYTLYGSYNRLKLRFYQNGTELYDLPASAWIEMGAMPTGYSTNKRWIRFYESSTEDYVTYKTYASAYDATHYSYTDGFVYTSITGSGDYTFSQMNISDDLVEIPVLKTMGEFQMDKAQIAWDNTQSKSNKNHPQLPKFSKHGMIANPTPKANNHRTEFSSVVLDFFSPNTITHPWLTGHPYQIQNPYKALTAYFKTGGVATAEVPPYFYLDYVVPDGYNPANMVLFSELNSNYIATNLTQSSTLDYDHFTKTDNHIECLPAYGGSLVHGDITNLSGSSFDIRMYQNMSINFNQVKLWMSSASPVDQGVNLSFNLTSAFNDPQNILSSQYNLTQTSPAYNISVTSSRRNTRAFYDTNQPLVYIKRNARRSELLFALIQDYNYRIYPYGQADTPDGWNYAVDGNYNKFYLTHNGQFATFTDNNPHESVSKVVISGASDMILSLYQAEFFLPSYFYANATPVGTQISLENQTDLSALPNALSATKLNILSSANVQIQTNFLSGYLTTEYPLLYIPFPHENSGQNIRFFHKNNAGVTTEYTLVTAFSASALTEFMIVGNTAVCFPNNPGTYYTTVTAK